jgi:hypothetical protein
MKPSDILVFVLVFIAAFIAVPQLVRRWFSQKKSSERPHKE